MKHKSQKKTRIYNRPIVIKEVFGLIVFLIIFVVLIPIIIYKNKLFNLLEVYLPNVDLVANLLTWTTGPYGIWKNLYRGDTIFEFTSQIVINYIALLGVTYIVAKETKKSNSIFEGMSFAAIMLLCTYLLPGNIVVWFMNESYKKFTSIKLTYDISNILATVVGGIVTLLFLFVEIELLKHYRKYIKKYLKVLLKPSDTFINYI